MHGLAWLICTGLLLSLLGWVANARSLPVLPLHIVQTEAASIAPPAYEQASCSATQLQGTCTDAEPGDWADLDLLAALSRVLFLLPVVPQFEARTPLVRVGVQPGLPPPRGQG